MIYVAFALIALILTIVCRQGFIMASLSQQIDTLTAAFNDETNALAARIDAFEIAQGSTVTQQQIDALRAISDRLKSLGAPVVVAAPEPAPAVVEAPATEPALVPLRASKAPKAIDG